MVVTGLVVPGPITAMVVTKLMVPGPVRAMVVTWLMVPGTITAMVVTKLMVPGPITAMVVTRLMVPGVAYLCPVAGGSAVMAAVVHTAYWSVRGGVGSVRGDGQRDRDAGAAEDG
jgi:hypothetical protein